MNPAAQRVRIPDHLGLACGALVLSLVVVALTWGGWLSIGAPLAAGVATTRALRARFAHADTGFDVRHRLGEGARSLAFVSLAFSAGMLVLNLVTASLARVP